MSKPDDIPQDVWDEGVKEAQHFVQWLDAGNSTGSLSPHAVEGLADSIARAIMAERERCAKVAEIWRTVIPMWDRPGGPPGNGPARAGTPDEIAASIRRGSK